MTEKELIQHYIVLHAPKVKLIGICIPFYTFSLQDGEDPWFQSSVGLSKGYLYDKNHLFWKNGLPPGFDSLVARSPFPPSGTDSLGRWLTTCDGWRGNQAELVGDIGWTVQDIVYQKNFNDLIEMVKMLSEKKIHLVAIQFPESPYYKQTDHFL